MRRKICEKRAVFEATTRSQASAMLQPIPTAGPRTATIGPAFYENYPLPAYTFDKTLVGLIDAHRFAGNRDAMGLLQRATDAVLPWLPGHAVDIRTRAESPTGAGDDDDADRVVKAQSGKVVAQPFTHLDIERIEFFRTVQHDLRDRPFDGQINRHSVSPDAQGDYNRRTWQRPGGRT